MTFNQLKTFYVVARSGSFTKAALELGLDQSNISRRILAMEASFKMPLFARHSRGLRLTPQGKVLFKETQGIIARFQEVTTNLQQEGQDLGSLWIGVSSSLYEGAFLSMLSSFIGKNPQGQISFQKIEDQAPFGETEDPGIGIRAYVHERRDLVQEFLGRFELKFYASPSYLSGRAPPASEAELWQHALVLPHRALKPQSRYTKGVLRNLQELTSVIYVNCPAIRASFVSEGAGIGLLPEKMVEKDYPSLVNVLPELEVHEDFFYIYSACHRKLRAVKDFGKLLQEGFQMV